MAAQLFDGSFVAAARLHTVSVIDAGKIPYLSLTKMTVLISGRGISMEKGVGDVCQTLARRDQDRPYRAH
jgi:hypothetical protein